MEFVNEKTNNSNSNNYYQPKQSYDARNIPTPKDSLREKRTLAIGDSFIGILKLLKKESNVRVEKIKGGTAKGLFRIGSESNTKLQSIMEGKHHYDCGIFNFGQVDHHISFYWDLIEKQQENDIEYYNTLAHNYVNFVANLPDFDRKIIFGVYPLPCTTDYVSKYLCCYTRIGDDKIEEYINNNREKWDELTSLERRTSRIVNFNTALEKECLTHEIEFASVYDKLVDENHNVLPTFKDPSDCNIHLLWEPLILEWCKYFHDQDTGIAEMYLEDIEQTGQAYLHEKTREVNKWKGIKDDESEQQITPSPNKYIDTYVAKDRRNNRNVPTNAHSNNSSSHEKPRYNYNNNRNDYPDASRGQGYDKRYDSRDSPNNNTGRYDRNSNGYNRPIGNNDRSAQGLNSFDRHNSTAAPTQATTSTATVATAASAPTNLYVPPHLRNKK